MKLVRGSAFRLILGHELLRDIQHCASNTPRSSAETTELLTSNLGRFAPLSTVS
jgi:hypothetical protein